MAEVKYESAQTSSSCTAEQIYKVVSDLRNIERVKDLIPQDRVSEIDFGEDFIRMKVDGLGQKICLRIVDKEENKTVKFGAENSPIQMNMWLQMKEVAAGDTRLKITLKADLPMMFKMMLDKKLQESVNQAAQMLASMPFDQWQ